MSASGPRGPLAPTAALARRSLRATWRQPANWIPAIIFPLLIAAVNASAMSRSTKLPGFPEVDSFLQFLLPATMVQGVLFGGINGGTEMALDVQSGFFERLLASPVPRVSILLGRLAGATLLGGIQALVFIVAFSVFGVRIEGGVASIAGLVAIGMVVALAVGGLAATIGLRTGSQEAVQGFFPLMFILLFISSAFFPVQLMSGAYREIAEHNPITWLIDGARSLVITGFSLENLARALLVGAVAAVASLFAAVRALESRVAS